MAHQTGDRKPREPRGARGESDCEKIIIHPFQKNNHPISGKLIQHLFYSKDTGRKNKKGDSIFGLFMKSMNNPSVEIVEGVESFNVKVNKNSVTVDFILNSVEAVNHGKRLRKEWAVVAKRF